MAEIVRWFAAKKMQALVTNFHMFPVIISCFRSSAAIVSFTETANSANVECPTVADLSFVSSVGFIDLDKLLA